jgi:hypothetical protein
MASAVLHPLRVLNRAQQRRGRNAYQYLPLNEDEKTIRLVTLDAGSFSDRIRVSLHTAVLSDESIPVYEALSYTWGSQKDPIDILVGPEENYLAVTRNLAKALPYLRYTDKPRILWIDAICVNQQDLKERSLQVQRMADVYSMADRVVVWIGTPSWKSDLALKAFKETAYHVSVEWATGGQLKPAARDDVNPDFANKDIEVPFVAPTLIAMIGVLSRPWFDRLWIWQEIQLANDKAIIVCGYEDITWKDFRKAVTCISTKAEGSSDSSELQYDLCNVARKVLRLCFSHLDADFIEMILNTRNSKCANPRDKVYALMGVMGKSVDKFPMQPPDYEKPVTEVYQETVVQHIKHFQRLSILKLCQGDIDSWNDLPSWVPDLRIPLTYTEKPRSQNADARTFAVVEFDEVSSMKLKGVSCQEISSVRVLDDFKAQQKSVLKIIRNLAPLAGLSGNFDPNGREFQEYCKTLFWGCFSENIIPQDRFRLTEEHARRNLSLILTHPKLDPIRLQDYSESIEVFLELAGGSMPDQSFFTTTDRSFGFAPKKAKQGDLIYVLLGCEFPVVLRRNPEGTFRLIGGCYTNKFMNGEAILGPVPSGIRTVWKYFPRLSPLGEHQPVFSENSIQQGPVDGHAQNETELIHTEDPRLGDLPQGWRTVGHDNEYAYNLYENEETGEVTRQHPNLRPESLIARGVDIQDIVLV